MATQPVIRQPIGGQPPLQYLRNKPNVFPVVDEYAPLPAANPLDYAFPAITPGGSLSAASPATITLPYGPLGVNGSDTHHYLYISGGTGAAEAVLITGGSCVSGASSSCTLQFTPANAHSGAWTIQSATGGIQEAFNAAGNLLLPYGASITVFATITPPANATIRGPNERAAQIVFAATNKVLFNVINDRFNIGHLLLVQSGTPVSGNVALWTHGPGASTPGTAQWGDINNLYVVGFYLGVIIEANEELLNANNLQVANCVSDGITLITVQGYWDAITSQGNGNNGIVMSGFCSCFMSNFQTFNNKGFGLSSTTNLYIAGGSSVFNGDKAGEINIDFPTTGVGNPAQIGYICDTLIQSAGNSPTYGTQANAPGIIVQNGSTGILLLHNCQFNLNMGNGVESSAPNVEIVDCIFTQSGIGGLASNVYSIYIGAGGTSTDAMVRGCRMDMPMIVNGSRTIVTDNNVIVNSNSLPACGIPSGADLVIANNVFNNAGSGGSINLASGVTYMHPATNICVGNVFNSGTPSSHSSAL